MERKKMQLPVTVDLSSLIETIVEIRFVPNSGLDRDLWAGLLVSRLEEAGYKYQKVPQLNVVPEGESSIKLTIDRENVSAVNLFVNNEDGIMLLIKGATMAFNCRKGKYIGWSQYLSKIVEILNIIEEEHIAEFYERTMIRYISEYKFNILEKVHIKVDSHSDDRYSTLEIGLTRKEGNINAFISISGLRERVSKPSKEKRVSSLFDVNVFEKLHENSGFDEVCRSLNSIHQIEKESFFGMLKEDYIKSLNPTY